MKIRKITITELTTAAFLLVLIILSKQSFFNINFGVMRIGVSYSFLIATGIILNLMLGLFIAVIGDTLALVIGGTIGLWHYSYFLIPIFIILITNSLKFLFKINNPKALILINTTFFVLIAITIFSLLILKNDFVKKSRNNELAIDLTNLATKIMMWLIYSLMLLYSTIITILYWQKGTEKMKYYVVINIIVTTIIVIVIWFYGPFANILWISDQFGKDYWSSYSLYQIPRILKTPINLVLYNFIVTAIFKIHKIVLGNKASTW